MLTPTKRSAVKITGVIFSIHVDDDGANHWVVTAGEIYFLRDLLLDSRPVVPGTGETIIVNHNVCFLTSL